MIQQGQVFKLKAKGPDGQPLWAYRYRNEGRGSERPQVGGFATRAEAEKALRKVLDRLGPGGGRVTITLAEFVDEYLEMHQAAPVTIAKLRWLLGKATTELGETRLAELSPRDVYAWRFSVPEGHRFEATQALRQVLNRAVAWGLIDYNPAKRGVPNPQRRAKEKRPFETWQQVEAVAAQLGPAYGPMIIFAAATGLRPSELFGLDRRDVDRQLGVVYIRRAYANGRIKHTKTRLSTRAVPLQAKALEALDRLPASDNPILFQNMRGGRIDFRIFGRKHWRPAQSKAGIAPVRGLLDLRHTYATFALRAGVPVFAVSRFMGTSIAMIDRHYGHLANDSREHAVALLDALAFERAVDAAWTCAAYGKWHVGEGAGRWPADHGFEEWYGPPRTYDESLWPTDPWYKPERDGVSRMVEIKHGDTDVTEGEQLTLEVRRDCDVEYLRRADTFIRRSADAGKPFFVYFNHSLMHMPTIPREEFKGRSGQGDWADCLLELDADFGTLLDLLDELDIADDTLVVFAGDNGPEDVLLWRGTPGYWEGSYFAGGEGNLRTPCIVRWPGVVQPGGASDEIMHVVDWFTTILSSAGAKPPNDRVIDGIDQLDWLSGKTDVSNREGYIYWMGPQMYGAKWRNFKLVLIEQMQEQDAPARLATPRLINLTIDPQEREPIALPHLHTWVAKHLNRVIGEFQASTKRESPIPMGAPLEHVPEQLPGS